MNKMNKNAPVEKLLQKIVNKLFYLLGLVQIRNDFQGGGWELKGNRISRHKHL